MRIFARPRKGYCASCEAFISGRPVYRMDEAYCCIGCAGGGPCICTYEADMADDGVDHLGLLFSMEPVAAEAPVTDGSPATARPLERSRSLA